MIKSVRNDTLYQALLVLSLSIAAAGIIIYASFKVIAGFFLLLVLIALYIATPPFTKIVFPMIMITFPVTLQVFGKDAFSTGTLIIFATLAWALAKRKIGATIKSDRVTFILLFLIAGVGLAGMVTKTPAAYWGRAVRHYVNLVSSIAVFILVIHAQNISGIADRKKEYIEKIITVLLLITVIHVFLTFLIFNFPWVEHYFSVFLRRNQESLGGHVVGGVYTRGTTVFTGGEEFGELLVLLLPFALYKLFASHKKMYWFVLAALLFGLLLSGTRSAFLLMALQTLIFTYFIVTQKYKTKKIVITLAVCCTVLIPPIFTKYSPILMDRVQTTIQMIDQEEDILSIVNRSFVWPIAYDVTKSTLSFFGHGPIQAHGLGFPVKNFHNLYMSLIFQFGVIGSLLFLTFIFVMAKRLLKRAKNLTKNGGQAYLLTMSCLLSLSCFLINEIKFEFNRSDSYQQFVWIFFAVFYLSGRLWQTDKNQRAQKYK